jgi:hypothetical protein
VLSKRSACVYLVCSQYSFLIICVMLRCTCAQLRLLRRILRVLSSMPCRTAFLISIQGEIQFFFGFAQIVFKVHSAYDVELLNTHTCRIRWTRSSPAPGPKLVRRRGTTPSVWTILTIVMRMENRIRDDLYVFANALLRQKRSRQVHLHEVAAPLQICTDLLSREKTRTRRP